jgi:host factor-I protein
MAYRTAPSANLTHKGKTPPPEETMQEAAYLKQLGEKQKPVSIKLRDGEIVRGWVEYYDRHMVRLTREDGPNLFIYKSEIVYISEGGKEATKRPRAKAKPDGEATTE